MSRPHKFTRVFRCTFLTERIFWLCLELVHWRRVNHWRFWADHAAGDYVAQHGIWYMLLEWGGQNSIHELRFTPDAVCWAAAAGRLDVIKWLRIHRNEKFSSWAVRYARTNGHQHVLTWLEENISMP